MEVPVHEPALVTVHDARTRDRVAARLRARGAVVQAGLDRGVLVLLDRSAFAEVRGWGEVECVGGVHLPTRTIRRVRRATA